MATPKPHTHASPLAIPDWYALRTRARCEKRVHGWLEAKGITANAAVACLDKTWSDRVKKVEEPLFPGYVFVHIAPRDFVEALTNPWAVNFLRGSKGPSPLRPEEMRAIAQLVEGATETGAPPIEVHYLTIGERVRVIEGPFKGIEGTLIEVRGATHVVVRIDALRVAKGVSVPRELLKRL